MTARKLDVVSLITLLGPWSNRGPAYRDLAGTLRQLILDGRLPLDVRLPSERELSAGLGVSRTTVSAAYDALRGDGFLLTRHGTRGRAALPIPAGAPGLLPPAGPAPAGDLLDLAYATLPAPPGRAQRAYAAALEALPAQLTTHGYSPLGLPALRELIAGRFAERGLPTAAEQIIVTLGAQHAFSLLVRSLTAPGDRVLVEHPTYPHALDALRQAACRLVPVAMTNQGWDLGALRAALRQTAPRMAYLIPDFQNPSGHCMPPEQRAAVALAAGEGRTTVVVDETLAELALDGPPQRPLAAFDRVAPGGHGGVVTVGSMSKSFWGGLRIGWIRAPLALAARIAAERAASDLGTPIFEQLAALSLLADADAVLAERRGTLRLQRAALVEELGRQLPDWRYQLPGGGLALWATLPAPLSSALAATSGRFGVRVTAGPRFGTEGLFERQLRLPFTLPGADLRRAITGLAHAWMVLGGWAVDPAAGPGAGEALV